MTPDGQVRVLLFHQDTRASAEVQSRLERSGFGVTCARSFLGAAPHLARGRSNLLLIYLPDSERVRNGFLTEVRRVAPSLPIVVIAPLLTDDLRQELFRFGVAAVLQAKTSWEEIVRTIRQELARIPVQDRPH